MSGMEETCLSAVLTPQPAASLPVTSLLAACAHIWSLERILAVEVAHPTWHVTKVKAPGSSMVQAGQGMSDGQGQLSGAALKPFPHQRTLNPSRGGPAVCGQRDFPVQKSHRRLW